MALFEFTLKDLKEVLPWGEEPELYLHWFGLTDGVYYIQAGKDQLFRASETILKYWSKKYNDIDISQPYVDYQIVRLYEDLLDILPDILAPVPMEVNLLVESISTQSKWESEMIQFFESNDSDESENLYYGATEWINFRKLSTFHLNQGPDIWMWRINDTIQIRWINDFKNIEGIQPWSSVSGQYELSVSDFFKEVESLHSRLMNEMEKRIGLLINNNPIPNIKIDINQLTTEHEERKTFLNSALKRVPREVNWSNVIKSNDKIRKA